MGANSPYADYLRLPELLSLQSPRSSEPDELLFIIAHQVTELWLKLLHQALSRAAEGLAEDKASQAREQLARAVVVERAMSGHWSVLRTLDPKDYSSFRPVFQNASGLQSLQYRAVEFLLGNRDAGRHKVFEGDPASAAQLTELARAPSLYDSFLRWLARTGHAIPASVLQRDVSLPHAASPDVSSALRKIYDDRHRFWTEHSMCEALLEVESEFQTWRFQHVLTVERVIGSKTGTGGTSGVSFLRRALDIRFFPELWEVRVQL